MLRRFCLWLQKRAKKKGRYYNITGRDVGDNDIYMKRFVVAKNKFFSIYIHEFWRSDYDVHHDHPWDFLTYIIRGGYTEEVLKWNSGNLFPHKRKVKAGNFLIRNAEHIHRVIIKEHSFPLTICVQGPKRRQWGFWKLEKEGEWKWTHWRPFLKVSEGFRNKEVREK